MLGERLHGACLDAVLRPFSQVDEDLPQCSAFGAFHPLRGVVDRLEGRRRRRPAAVHALAILPRLEGPSNIIRIEQVQLYRV